MITPRRSRARKSGLADRPQLTARARASGNKTVQLCVFRAAAILHLRAAPINGNSRTCRFAPSCGAKKCCQRGLRRHGQSPAASLLIRSPILPGQSSSEENRARFIAPGRVTIQDLRNAHYLYEPHGITSSRERRGLNNRARARAIKLYKQRYRKLS